MPNPFITGINYWPGNKAMFWWKTFSAEETALDFTNLAKASFQVIRIFLLWEDFQPTPDKIASQSLNNLYRVADLADQYGLQIMPTFFCGHMSGLNFLPTWMTAPAKQDIRFLVYNRNKIQKAQALNFYADPALYEAQLWQVEKICSSLKGHAALFAYDLGNEASNCVIPESREQGRRWLSLLSGAVKKYSGNVPVTIGLHAEDLEEDRLLGPQDAALFCDFLSMHAYPFYLSWLQDSHDIYLVPFLGLITNWLGNKPVLLQEYGAPSQGQATNSIHQLSGPYQLWSEQETADYYRQVTILLYKLGFMGAFPWCYSDYHRDLWEYPPLNNMIHERYFGLFQANGQAKKAVEVFRQKEYLKELHVSIEADWNRAFNAKQFYNDPLFYLEEMFTLFKKSIRVNI